jgi:hypothetical protein
MKEYSDEYVERIEAAAQDLMNAAELAISIIDKTRIALVNPDIAQKKLEDALQRYNGISLDFDNS